MEKLRLRRRHKAGLLGLIITILAIVATQSGWLNNTAKKAQLNQPAGFYSIHHYIDGDTIAVNMNGSVETVRMIGVDTPETHRPNTPVQCYGPQAADFTKNLISQFGKVRLQADPQDTNRDRYGRLLRYVYLPDGRMVEKELISSGYGFAYTLFPFVKKDEFTVAQTNARQAGKGLWSTCQVTTRSDGAGQTNPIQ